MNEDYDELPVKIYLADKKISVCKGKSNEEIIDIIINSHNQNPNVGESKKFTKEPIDPTLQLGDLSVDVYVAKKTSKPKWKDFLIPILGEGAELRKELRNKDIAYLCFIANADHLFIVSGGHGNVVIQKFVDPDFGTNVLSRLINKSDKAIKHIEERVITGDLFAGARFFRGDHKLSDEFEFGKIYKSIKAKVGLDFLKKLDFTQEEIKRNVVCLASSCFEIGKSITIFKLFKLIRKLSVLLNKKANFKLNAVKQLSPLKRREKEYIEQLNEKLWHSLYDIYTNASDAVFDFCNPDFHKFLIDADYYEVVKGSRNYELPELYSLAQLFITLKTENLIRSESFSVFKSDMEKLRILSHSLHQSEPLTDDSFIKHVHGEIEHEDLSYFYIDGSWYEIDVTFIEQANEKCVEVLTENKSELELLPWKYGSDETEYIQEHIGQSGYTVLHTVTPENIELCDILFEDSRSSTLYVIHIKRGFDAMMRDLTSQMLVASLRLMEDKRNGYEYVKNVYSSMQSSADQNISGQATRTSQSDFVAKFSDAKRIVFCLAFCDKKNPSRDAIANIKKFKSNIAKLELIHINADIRNYVSNFDVLQIARCA